MRLRGYLLENVEKSTSTTLVRILLPCTIVVAGVWIIYFVGRAVLFPYPLEYREGASLVLTALLLRNQNPFTLANQPLGTNNYGLLYNMLALPAAALWGNTLLVHRLITALSIALSAVLVFWTARSSRRMTAPAILAAEMVVLGLAARGGVGAFPAAMGAFFYLAALLIPYKAGFSLGSLAVSVVMCLLAFYTKPYFVLAVGIVGSYVFLFHSKSRGLAYLLFFGLLFSGAFFVVRALLPLYFYDTVISNLLQASSLDAAHLGRQCLELLKEYFPAVVAVIVVGLVAMSTKADGPRRPIRAGPRLRIADRQSPLLSMTVGYVGYATLFSALTFVLVLGRNPGSYLTPAFQLVVPPFMLWIVSHVRSRNRLASIVLALLQLNVLYYTYTWMNPAMLSQLWQTSGRWMRLYNLADTPGKILNSPVLAAEMVGQGVWPGDSGQTEYYYTDLEEYRGTALVGPDQVTINADGRAYLDQIKDSIQRGAYDRLILTDEPRPPLFRYGVVRRSYHPTQTITLPMPLVPERWDIVVWEPDPTPE